jgi:hypothetical protein
MRAEVLRCLRVANTVRFSPAGTAADYTWIDNALNRAQDDFARQTRCLKGYSVVCLKANRRVFRLPEDLLELDAVYLYDSTLEDGYRELPLVTIAELNDMRPGWRTDTGTTPERCYIDRDYGSIKLLGLHPIPVEDGDTILPDTDYGCLVEWVCPLYTFNSDFGVILNVDSEDEYILPTQGGVAVEVDVTDGNLYLEYSRLPSSIAENGSASTQYPQIQREYQASLWFWAVNDLLSHNPEDSAEYKRAMGFKQRFDREVETYKNKKKRPMPARKLRVRADQWNYITQTPWYRDIP